MSDEKPKRDGIAEILASGRAPGVVVRGGRSLNFEIPYVPGVSKGFSDPKARKRSDEKVIAEARDAYLKAKAAHGLSRKKDGKLRHIGRMPLEADVALRKKFGDEYKGEGQQRILKEHGFVWDS